MTVILHAYPIYDIVAIAHIRIGIAHEGIERSFRHAVLVSQRHVELFIGIASTQSDAVGIFPVGEVSCRSHVCAVRVERTILETILFVHRAHIVVA